METPKVFESEYRFCLILWEHEPIKSTELAKLCEAELGWKAQYGIEDMCADSWKWQSMNPNGYGEEA